MATDVVAAKIVQPFDVRVGAVLPTKKFCATPIVEQYATVLVMALSEPPLFKMEVEVPLAVVGLNVIVEVFWSRYDSQTKLCFVKAFLIAVA